MSAPVVTGQALARLHAKGFEQGWSAPDFDAHIARQSDHITARFNGHDLTSFALLRLAADQAEILTITVHPDCQNKGIGKAVLNDAEQEVKGKGVDIIFLDVAVDNHAAIALYRSAGYSQYGKRPGYYKRDGERVGALLFQKRLK